jgi:hypothetical protein
VVAWPGGAREAWRDISSDTLRVLQQGSGEPWQAGD